MSSPRYLFYRYGLHRYLCIQAQHNPLLLNPDIKSVSNLSPKVGISAIVILVLVFLGLCITRQWGSVFRVRAATSMIFSKVNPQENCDSDTDPDSESDDPISTSGTGSRKKAHKAPPTGYAPLFNKWPIISRLPLIRQLWKQSLYQYSLPKRLPLPPKPSEQIKPSYPIDQFQPRSVVDYPLRRARLLAATLMKEGIAWMRMKLASFRRGREEDKRSDWGPHAGDAAAVRRTFTFPDGTQLLETTLRSKDREEEFILLFFCF